MLWSGPSDNIELHSACSSDMFEKHSYTFKFDAYSRFFFNSMSVVIRECGLGEAINNCSVLTFGDATATVCSCDKGLCNDAKSLSAETITSLTIAVFLNFCRIFLWRKLSHASLSECHHDLTFTQQLRMAESYARASLATTTTAASSAARSYIVWIDERPLTTCCGVQLGPSGSRG